LATVAPGIAEALVATAIGLFAAIPAVVAYNRFARDLDRIAIQQETFIEEFSQHPAAQRQCRKPRSPALAQPPRNHHASSRSTAAVAAARSTRSTWCPSSM